ncbi:hypothetical protein CYMTET_53213 [Cymbomonas tetramitiformis]|uniref:Uncharacterized protein n=1 Tax=Cymbomonas tetramitiformis TaxID=36881 RepID=A0AAE0BJ57_9CHLO|nr:hypothetical protein CYMTET_53213 [Cymbomonas tetramitiformis]
MADLDGAFVKSLFVLEVSNRLKVAGGKFDDISLEVPENAEFLTQLENAVGKTENDISIGDITNIDLGKDLMLTGKNPHLPLDVDIIRIPLLANLSARAKRFVEKRLFKGRDVPDDVPEGLRDMQAMARRGRESSSREGSFTEIGAFCLLEETQVAAFHKQQNRIVPSATDLPLTLCM